jgi:hypothetical protein
MFLGIVRSSRQMEDHGVTTLELRELSKVPCVVLELVVRKGGTDNDVFSQSIALFVFDVGTVLWLQAIDELRHDVRC